MNKKEQVVNAYAQGFNCAQSVLSVFSERFGIDVSAALKIGSAFGGGYAQQGKVCGAITGALMVLGLKYPRLEPESEKQKERINNLAADFIKNFQQRNKDLTYCRDLLEYDVSTEEGRLAAKENNARKKCEKYVQDAVEILEDMFFRGYNEFNYR
ncbi:MAG TPA: C_GCAxxG_C_C family protein [Candidatus Cloacimonetes bacterium]|nr:C_GCAxxG_C_C family protein [Candidatus Cloacimonadota bacterium]